MPKQTPVKMFQRPENTSVVDSEMDLLTAKAIISGNNVPRSPREPEISARGLFRSVVTLLMWRCRMRFQLRFQSIFEFVKILTLPIGTESDWCSPLDCYFDKSL